MFIPRPKQQEVLAYTKGKMGVSAVPGSGKTQTLSYLAAKLVAEADLEDDQEVLIVTLVNSAVDNFAQRVNEFVKERDLIPNVGYRVCTLHSLAHDIVRERPALVGLADDFQILDERETTQILQDAAQAWAGAHPDVADGLLNPELDDRKREWVRREHWPKLAGELAANMVRQAKDLRRQVTPSVLRDALDKLPEPLPMLEMSCAVYGDYQRALAYRGAVDYDDLIRLALQAIELDGEYLKRLRNRWPFILEDEAQDSSRLQEDILRLLAGPNGNWVRVGDPNQAIYETFTTASPLYLRQFLAEPDVARRELPNSGRSTQSIIDLANYLVDWAQTRHPLPELSEALAPPHIEPTPPGDPQPNPLDNPGGVMLDARNLTPAEERDEVVDSVARWLPENQDKTVAILVPRNDRGEDVVGALKARRIECVELLRSTRATREAAGALGNVLNFLADPASPTRLATAFRVWRRADREDPDAREPMEAAAKALRRFGHVEDFLWPRLPQLPRLREPVRNERFSTGLPAGSGRFSADQPARSGRFSADALESLGNLATEQQSPDVLAGLEQFRELARRWQDAVTLPIDQLILTIAGDLFNRPADLAVSHKLAVVLRQAGESHPDWRLAELTQELALIARNERKFLGFSDDDTGFDPDKHRGKVVVATIHKAKGLEWDKVYLMSCNNYDFPSAQTYDTFISERWYIRDGLNLEAEALAQLRAVFAEDIVAPYAPLGQATRQARLDYAAERLRLLYVGITRARQELTITWNTGRQPRRELRPSVPFLALQTWWEESKIPCLSGRRTRQVEDPDEDPVPPAPTGLQGFGVLFGKDQPHAADGTAS